MQISKHPLAQAYITVIAKTAAPLFGPGDMGRLKSFGKTMMEVAPVAIPLAGLAAQGIGAVVAKMTEASRKAQAFKSMMDDNPALHDRDAADVQRYFNTLHRLNPELASDPSVAASFVNNMASMNRPDMPHPALFEQATKLVGLRKPEAGGKGKNEMLSLLVHGMGEMGKQDQKSQVGDMQHDLKVQERYNRMLRQHARSMRGRAESAEGALQRGLHRT